MWLASLTGGRSRTGGSSRRSLSRCRSLMRSQSGEIETLIRSKSGEVALWYNRVRNVPRMSRSASAFHVQPRQPPGMLSATKPSNAKPGLDGITPAYNHIRMSLGLPSGMPEGKW